MFHLGDHTERKATQNFARPSHKAWRMGVLLAVLAFAGILVTVTRAYHACTVLALASALRVSAALVVF